MNTSSNADVTQLVEQILASGKISRRQYHQLSNAILADETIDEAEAEQVKRMFQAIQTGRLKVVE